MGVVKAASSPATNDLRLHMFYVDVDDNQVAQTTFTNERVG